MSSTRSDLYKRKKEIMIRQSPYCFVYYKYWNFDILKDIMYIRRSGKSKCESYNDCIIMLDTETSKEEPATVCRNYVVAWTISIRAYGINIVTLYGTKPSECVKALNKIIMAMSGDKTIIYIHNMSYDWVFLRKYLMMEYGTPLHQLNVKPHYPISIEFANGLIFRDSLILAQRSLDKWAKDMDVQHKKASGFWDYDAVRHQDGRFSPHEKTYIEHDTLAGVECIEKTMQALNKRVYSMPYTATGIPREIVQKLATANKGRDLFKRIVPDYEVQLMLEEIFHGGYTHNNRHFIQRIVTEIVKAYDEASAYPYVMLTEKYPMQRFKPLDEVVDPEFILESADEYAFMFRLILVKPRLKSDKISMPALQKSKCRKMINAVEDNGRILCAELIEIRLNEIDLGIIMQQYDFDAAACTDVYYSEKDYLPKWFTDFIYKCFVDKTMLKGGDPVQYSIAKAKLNSLYGMCVQRPVKLIIEENYKTGDYSTSEDQDPKELYQKYIDNRRSVLPYQWGVWVTSYAFRNLFTIGSHAGTWLYSDTDSCYGYDWDEEGIAAYNEQCKAKLLSRGYGPVNHNNREYWLGICEVDGTYKEFVSVGAKRYAVRMLNDDIKITVAGVPKAGKICLKNDLRNFHSGFIFDGETTGKKQHTYFMEEDIWTDEHGNERGDSIDLSPASYQLDSVRNVDWEKIFEEEIEVIAYDSKVL